MRTLLVHAHVPLGRSMSSPGVRSFRIAEALAADFGVTLMAPGSPGAAPKGVRGVEAPRDAAAVADELRRHDVVVAQKLPLAVLRKLGRSRPRILFDLYTPALPEGLATLSAQGAPRRLRLLLDAEALAQLVALASGDGFVCTSEPQRDFWLGGLAALGRVDLAEFRRDPTLRALIDVVPFGIGEEPPAPRPPALKGVVPGIAREDRVVLWAGGVLDWTDAETPIRAVARIASRRPDVKLYFLGFDPDSRAGRRALQLARELDVLERSVFFGGWVPYDLRSAYLLESDLGIGAYFEILEARLAYRARLLDYVWAGLPIVTTSGEVLGELVATRGLGRAVGAGDVDGCARAIEELLESAAHAAAVEAIERIRPELTWSRAVEPLRQLASAGGGEGRLPGAPLALRDAVARLRVSKELRGTTGLVARQAGRFAGRR